MRGSLIVVVFDLLILTGCGYSTEQWQAQLAKRDHLEQQILEERKKIERLEAERASREEAKQ